MRRGVEIMAMPEGLFDSSFPFWFPVIDRRIANEKDFLLRSK